MFFALNMHQNSFVAGAPLPTSLGSSRRSPYPLIETLEEGSEVGYSDTDEEPSINPGGSSTNSFPVTSAIMQNDGRGQSAYIIDFPNLGSTYNGGWCTATETDETLITRPSREVNVK